MDDIPEGFSEADFGGQFLKHNGPFYMKREGECWLVAQRVSAKHVNYLGIAHGGMISTLADVALSAQPFFSERPNPAVTTSSMTLNFVSAAREGDWIVAETIIDRLGKRNAQVHGRIHRDGETLATMSGVFSVRRATGESS